MSRSRAVVALTTRPVASVADRMVVTNDDRLLSYEEAAVLLGVGVATLQVWVHRRRVPHVRLGARTVKFRRGELAAWIALRSVEASS